jgi:hypothetical protein
MNLDMTEFRNVCSLFLWASSQHRCGHMSDGENYLIRDATKPTYLQSELVCSQNRQLTHVSPDDPQLHILTSGLAHVASMP